MRKGDIFGTSCGKPCNNKNGRKSYLTFPLILDSFFKEAQYWTIVMHNSILTNCFLAKVTSLNC